MNVPTYKTKDPLNVARGQGNHVLKEIFETIDYNEENLIFIDRDPRFFGIVLDFLRTVNMTTDDFFENYGQNYDTYEGSFNNKKTGY